MPLSFHHPLLLTLALLLMLATLAIARRRRIAFPRTAQTLIALGLLSLALAAGHPVWHRPGVREVLVLVDLSPSTRTARYRDLDALQRRIRQLLPSTPHRLLAFAESTAPLPPGPTLPDLPADRTIFQPPPAPAILLFSDARFDLPPSAPPTFIVVDPLLQDPPDAAVKRLEIRGATLAATARNPNEARQLQIGSARYPIQGSQVVTQPLPAGAKEVTARLTGADPWPENDAVSIRVPTGGQLARFWVGKGVPEGWVGGALPVEAADYLGFSVLALNNVPATALSETQQDRILQYVRDLGGSLLLLGGDQAFAAGSYPGSVLEKLSPLASTPPKPSIHWILLADSSGSMAQQNRWPHARAALLQTLAHLPPNDLVSIGNFSDYARWWSAAKPVRPAPTVPEIHPTGPTNLQLVLQSLANTTSLPGEVLLLSDLDAEINNPESLAADFQAKRLRLHVLAIGQGRGYAALQQIARATGGTFVQELSPEQWVKATRELADRARPDYLQRGSFPLDTRLLPPRTIQLPNRTWVKEGSETLGTAGSLPALARWQVGTGQVLAAAFPATPAEAAALADHVAQAPKDPRFTVTWDIGERLGVRIDATDKGLYINDLDFNLDGRAIPQVGPGRYELSAPAPHDPVIVTLRLGSQVVERKPVAGRYAPEFDAIGNDGPAMKALAARTGGRVIPPTLTHPLSLPFPPQTHSLLTPFSLLGAVLLATGLLIGHGLLHRAAERAMNFTGR